MNTYKIYSILAYIPNALITFLTAWNHTCWHYCHYVYGKGPRPNYETNLFKVFKNNLNSY